MSAPRNVMVSRASRSDLRELNEQNFARFDARLEQRLAELRAELRGEIGALRADMRGEIGALRGDTRAELHSLKPDLIKWMFVFWAGTALTGLLVR